MAIYPIATARVSDLLLRRRSISQFQSDRVDLLRLQDAISTGLRFTTPSDDAPSALRAISLQRSIEEKQQARTNLQTGQSYIGATDTALAGVADLVAQIRANALTMIDSTVGDNRRSTMVQEIQYSIEQLVELGNRTFRGRSLFAGSATGLQPFEIDGPHVVYHGNESKLQSFVDVGSLLDTNVTGDEAFGAISAAVAGTIDLNPILTEQTKLADLNGGAGIDRGSFLISDGNSTRTIDISGAETIGDVVRLIEANPPEGRVIGARLSSSGLIVDIDSGGGNLTIRESAGGSTAADLRILDPVGVGSGQIQGGDLEPRLLPTTRLSDVLGTRAAAVLTFVGSSNDIFVEAASNGAEFDGTLIQFTGGAAGDSATAGYDAGTNTLTIDVNPGVTTANTVLDAINAEGTFRAQLDRKFDIGSDGRGIVDPSLTAQTTGGSGVALDQQSGIQIVNAGTTHTITFDDAETVEDLLNILNGSGAGIAARISESGDRIDVRSRVSGADLHIGENGGTTATELGIRTFGRDVRLSALNYGQGVDVVSGPDFRIQRKDGVTIDIDISDADTVADVIDTINLHSANQDPSTQVVARISAFGNGIELVDANASGTSVVTVSRATGFSAWDLGFVPRGEDSATATAGPATSQIVYPPPDDLNTGIALTAVDPGPAWNGFDIQIVESGSVTGNDAVVTYDAIGQQILVDIDSTQTTAATVIDRINAAGTPFTAALDTSTDLSNDGSGLAQVFATTSAGGFEDPFRSADVNPVETAGVFNSLFRLASAVEDADFGRIERAVAMLDDDFDRLNMTRAHVGHRGQTFDALMVRLDAEEVDLRATLSDEIDTDFVQAISDLTARQASIEATLRTIGTSLSLTVLDFI